MPNRHETLTSLFEDVADAIRDKTGSNELIKADNFDTAIAAIPSGGLDPNDFKFSGSLEDWCAQGQWSNIIHKGLSYLEFTDITSTQNMWNHYSYEDDLSDIEINFATSSSGVDMSTMFAYSQISKAPKLINAKCTRTGLPNLFLYCSNLRELDSNFSIDTSLVSDYTSGSFGSVFSNCNSLRHVSQSFVNTLKGSATTSSRLFNNNSYSGCYALEELYFNCPDITITSNMFSSWGGYYNARHIIFETNNGTPLVRNWSNQNISFGSGIGYFVSLGFITTAHLSTDKIIRDQSTYDLYKNDPDAVVLDLYSENYGDFSWFNHDAFVEFLESLPDVSGGTNNRITNVDGRSGNYTDAGAISTITAAEIAIATNKGWTIAFK